MLCNYLQNVAAITYIFVLQLSTFLFYNKHYKDIQFFDGCARQVLYKTVVLVLANRDQMRYNESKWGTQMDGLRVDVIVLT